MNRYVDRIWFCDSETFAEDNLWCFNKLTDENEWRYIHNDNQSITDFLNETNPILVGYNIKGYDLHILKGNLLNYDPFAIKEINDWIIKEHQSGWSFPFEHWVDTPPICDLMLDIVPVKSLKETEGNFGMDITESTIDFDNPNAWDEDMYNEMVYYCKADVKALRPLYNARISYLQTKLNLAENIKGKNYPLKALSMTNAQVVAEYVEAVPIEVDDNEEYTPAETLVKTGRLDNIPQNIIHFYKTMKPKLDRYGMVNPDASPSLEVDIAGCPHKLGFGGLHGALPSYIEIADDKRIILNFDAFSFYPSIMLLFNRLSRAVTRRDRVVDAYNRRKASKFDPNSNISKAEIKTLKLILNTLYGISGAKFSKCYDPLMLKSVCVDGQLTLISLIVDLLNIPSYRHIQSNTDGIMFSIDRVDYNKVLAIVHHFEELTGFIMEEDRIKKVIQRDVNNYIVEFENGKIKTKGSLFAPLSKEVYEANSMKIVSEAILDYFIKGTPVAETINNCNDPVKFQMVAKTGNSYQCTAHEVDGNLYPVQKVNRIYASKDTYLGKVYKMKLTDEKYLIKKQAKALGKRAMANRPTWEYMGQDDDGKHCYRIPREYFDGQYVLRQDTIANCPEHATISNNLKISIDEINKDWYTSYASKAIEHFIKEDKMAKKAEVKEKVTEEIKEEEVKEEIKEEVKEEAVTEETEKESTDVDETVTTDEPEKESAECNVSEDIPSMDEASYRNILTTFYRKFHEMRKVIAQYQLQADGYNTNQNYEYAKAWQYKSMLNKACLEAGMEFFCELDVHSIERLDIKSSDKMELTRIKGYITFIDIDTGHCKTFTHVAEAADNLDKGLYKAETMFIKSFVQMTFLRGNDDSDVEFTGNVAPQSIGSGSVAISTGSESHKPVDRATAKNTVLNSEQMADENTLNKIAELVIKCREKNADYRKNDGSLDAYNEGTLTQVNAVMLLNDIEDDLESL